MGPVSIAGESGPERRDARPHALYVWSAGETIEAIGGRTVLTSDEPSSPLRRTVPSVRSSREMESCLDTVASSECELAGFEARVVTET